MKLYKYCMICGRKLIGIENRQRGMGEICYKKYLRNPKAYKLVNVENSNRLC